MIKLTMTLEAPASAGGGTTAKLITVTRDVELGLTLRTPEDADRLKLMWSNLLFNQLESINGSLFEAFKKAAQEPPVTETKPNGNDAGVPPVRPVETGKSK
jgi:hypothetical protein